MADVTIHLQRRQGPDPDTKGSIGQVIRFGRNEDTKRLVAENFDHFVSVLVTAVAVARWNGEYLESTV